MPASPLSLREPTLADHPTLLRWRSNPEHRRLLMWRGGAPSAAEVEAWLARRTNDPEGRFLIVARGDSAIGFVQLTRIDRVDGHAYLGLLIDPLERGHGAGTEALRTMERQCRELGLRKILLEVLGDNAGALRFWTAEGYRVVGTLRGHHLHDGVHHDVIVLEKLFVPPSSS